MAKFAADAVLDGLLDIVQTSIEMYLTIGQPADRAAAIANSVVPAVMMAPGDFTKANYAGGREQTTAAKNGLTANATGTPDHVALCTGSALLYVSEVSNPQLVTSGNTVNIGSWKVQVADPT